MKKILFICTHNRCRSILAEAITNHLGDGLLAARSAGSQPAGEVHPLSLQYLQEAGIETNYLKSQSWDDHEQWHPDIVITVCDDAAGEACPVWFGNSIKVHWGLRDPSRATGDAAEIARAFRNALAILNFRIGELLNNHRDLLEDSGASQQDKLAAILQKLARLYP
jgi:arsenate reductase (thioredoxin)